MKSKICEKEQDVENRRNKMISGERERGQETFFASPPLFWKNGKIRS